MMYRKILLASAAVLAFSTGTAFAAVDVSVINQTGTSDVGIVTQVSQASDGDSFIKQTGNNDSVGTAPSTAGVTQVGPGAHSSYVDQTGNNDSATIYQHGTAPSASYGSPLNNTSDGAAETTYGSFILQQGANGTVSVDQSGAGAGRNASDVTQSSSANYADAIVTQVNNGASASSATILQGQTNASGNANGTAIDASIDQTGTGNFADIYQAYAADHSYASIYQYGNSNYASIEQYASNNLATISQTGNSNDSAGTYFGHTWGIEQGSPNNVAHVTENGDDFKSLVVQGAAGAGAGGNLASVLQSVNFGAISSVFQNGGAGLAVVSQ